ncbi:MAG: hypothetical protein ABR577_14720 [Pyrinomonadaceae bacterium]
MKQPVSRLWYMNADFEMELAAASTGGVYRRPASFVEINRRLAAHFLWLARPGDALLLDESPSMELALQAIERGVELISNTHTTDQSHRVFTPWGWTKSAVMVGEKFSAMMCYPALETIARVNSKLWSYQLERELGVAVEGSACAATFDELQAAISRACPNPEDKWVIKSPHGFAARERVLGRGAILEGASATWARRRFAQHETLLFQPWLNVIREYGIAMNILPDGEVIIEGISDLQTNGAGTGTGYILGRQPSAQRAAELLNMAKIVGARLFKEGYTGATGMDALEHAGGLHPLLEINARYTMGHVAVAIERALQPKTPVFWSMK